MLGLVNDADRDRAERDLEIDAEFRDAVVRIAERMHMIDLGPAPQAVAPDQWHLLAQRIGGMPHMRPGSLETRKPEAIGGGLHAVPSRRAASFAIALIAAFAAGYLAALWRP